MRKFAGIHLVMMAATLIGCRGERPDPGRYPVIPLPKEIEPKRGAFVLDANTRIRLLPSDDPELRRILDAWVGKARAFTTFSLPIAAGGGPEDGNVILVRLRETHEDDGGSAVPAGHGLPGFTAESYELDVRTDAVTLEAFGYPGIFYGLETFLQLLEANGPPGSDALAIPAVDIDDAPRFRYRGMHLDVGRHFFPVSFVKRYLDFLAAYKMNVFHWHLTEDQGWRIEIRGYPRLTEVGSCRAETILEKNFDPYVGDGIPYCGFYTQDEIREVVEYARERFITVMPEIEMPGHSVAALAAYPELACTPGPFEVHTRWGVTEDIYCPREETFTFLEGVLSEVMDLFPSPLIHIGGDEAPKTAWENSELAQAVMEREGLADEEELQSWFIRRIEAFLNANGRSLVGWDEILEGGLAPNATVMSWRGMAGGSDAARQGHDVIMTPNSHAYLDYYQGDTIQEPLAIGGFSPLEKVYGFEPVPPDLGRSRAAHILGAQGNVWTEYIATGESVEYMTLPRMIALSEVVWSPRDARNLDSFLQRLPAHFTRLDRLGANYRIPDVSGLSGDRLTLAKLVTVELSAPVEEGEIRYTLDGTDPGPDSPPYESPLALELDEDGTEVAARVILPDGRAGGIRRARFSQARLASPTPLPSRGLVPGLAGTLIPGEFPSVDSLPATGSPGTANTTVVAVPRVTLPAARPRESFGLVLNGFIRVPRNGIYTFFLTSDDGSRVRIAEKTVVDHDGYHGMSEKPGQVALHRGWHPIQVQYFQGGGGAGIKLDVALPGKARREIPSRWFIHVRPEPRPGESVP
ncbi:MAG: family 20 glycosylhydrolase [Longimicrobiales bacterium]